MAAPIIESTEVANGASGTAITANKPSGVAAGDLLIAHIAFIGARSMSSIPTGWNLIDNTEETNTLAESWIGYKVAGASEPSSYTFNINATSSWCISIQRISGTADPSSNVIESANDEAWDTNWNTPSVFPSDNESLVLRSLAIDAGGRTITVPAGTTEVANIDSGDMQLAVCSLEHGASATGDDPFTVSGGGRPWVGVTLSVAPIAGGGSTLLGRRGVRGLNRGIQRGIAV